GRTTELNPGAQQPRANRVSAQTGALAQPGDGLTVFVEADEFTRGHGLSGPAGPADLDANLDELLSQRLPEDADFLGQPGQRFARNVAGSVVLNVRDSDGAARQHAGPCHLGPAADVDASLAEPAGEQRWADALLLGELRDRFPGQVATDEVTDVR